MSILHSRHIIGLLIILVILILVVSFLIISFGYFNNKEISLLTSKCYESGGEVVLEIHEYITSSYSFECKK